MTSITSIDDERLSEILADMGADFRAEFAAADATTQRALVGYLATYSGPWGLKASEEDAVFGIIRAVWPEWAGDNPSLGFQKMRADERLGKIADDLFEDAGETPLITAVTRAVAQLRPIIAPCTCEMWDDGNGETGPHLHVEHDVLCPQHGRKAEPAQWNDGWGMDTSTYLMSAWDTASGA